MKYEFYSINHDIELLVFISPLIFPSLPSFPSSAWERLPGKLCLPTPPGTATLRLLSPPTAKQSLATRHPYPRPERRSSYFFTTIIY